MFERTGSKKKPVNNAHEQAAISKHASERRIERVNFPVDTVGMMFQSRDMTIR